MAAPLHAVIVSCPFQGHLNALMNLAELLAVRGFFITFVTTEWMDQRLLKAASKDAAVRSDRNFQERGFKFWFLTIPDGLPPEHGRTTEITELMVALQRLGPTLESVLTAADESQAVPPITCIVSDSYLSCTAQVCKNIGVPRVIFWSTCTAYSIIHKNADFLLSLGHIPVAGLKSEEKVITCLPGKIPPIRPTDIVSFFREKYISDNLYNILPYKSRFQSIADYVLVNTFEELEGGEEAQMGLSVNGCPALAVGPVSLPNFKEGRNSMCSMWEEDKSCLQWLDSQPKQSVLYVSFGSIAVKSEKQLHELALGLEDSGCPFLWVLRLDIVEGKSVELPEGFMDRTKDRALIVSWTNQLKVLSHPSIGGFLTHSGWNSTLEAITMGVPLIGWPYFGDQFLDCRFARDIWKFGLDFKGVNVDEFKLVTKEVVESAIRNLMESSIGKELRENVVMLKKAARKAVMEGGTSHTNLNTFVEDMQKIAKFIV